MIPVILSAEQFKQRVKRGKIFAVGGFRRSGTPQQLLRLLRNSYDESGYPSGITLVFSSTPTDPGVDILAKEGLLDCVIGSFLGSIPEIRALIQTNRIKGYSLPQGQISLLFREIGRGSPGLISRIGMFSFVDPVNGGGKLNDKTTENIVERVQLFEADYLFYKALKINVALLRGSSVDPEGNISMYQEPIKTEFLSMAQAAKSSGGQVFVQVLESSEQLFQPEDVDLPACLVDGVVICENPEQDHRQTNRHQYFEGYSSRDQQAHPPLQGDDVLYKKIIAKRALGELVDVKILNLGQGLPELVGSYAKNYPQKYGDIFICLESGVIGGTPERRPDFGVAVNPSAFLTQDNQFVSFNGGLLDMAILSFAQIDQFGRINVSRIGGAEFGGGGFMDIVFITKRIVFVGSFTTKGLNISDRDGSLEIKSEGKIQKFVKAVDQVTFTPALPEAEQKLKIITERCTFEIKNGALTLTEILRGINLEQDILEQMEFRPQIAKTLKVVDFNLKEFE